ncbi:MAG TPA: site-specific integrase, partial [Clostridium sp.]
MNNFYSYLEDYASSCIAKGLSIKSIKSYEQSLTLLILYLEGEEGLKKPIETHENHIRSTVLY